MSIHYKLYQSNRNNNPNKGKWYARAVHNGTMKTNDLADRVQRNCSMKKSDVKGVIEELIEVMTDLLQEGYRVQLDGLGSFKINLKSVGADLPSDFKATRHIVGSRVVFMPAKTTDGSRVQHTTFKDGVQWRELPKNDVDTSNGETSGSGEDAQNP